ncbi:hypothetical protein MKEN_00678800 [Mycena kentingensis (nom. inval.)]|nr:hypothetical protein MKEN_00678800 [Mycena kentingensis (nom. inval.)]
MAPPFFDPPQSNHPTTLTLGTTRSHIPRAPIVNPYEKFTQPQFDAWVGDITGALRDALGFRAKTPPRAKTKREWHVPRRDASIEEEQVEQQNDEAAEEEDMVPESANAKDKGKGRDPREGPGLRGAKGVGDRETPIEIGDSDDEMEQDEELDDEEYDSQFSSSEDDESEEEDALRNGESSAQANERNRKYAARLAAPSYDDGDEEEEEEAEEDASDSDQLRVNGGDYQHHQIVYTQDDYDEGQETGSESESDGGNGSSPPRQLVATFDEEDELADEEMAPQVFNVDDSDEDSAPANLDDDILPASSPIQTSPVEPIASSFSQPPEVFNIDEDSDPIQELTTPSQSDALQTDDISTAGHFSNADQSQPAYPVQDVKQRDLDWNWDNPPAFSQGVTATGPGHLATPLVEAGDDLFDDVTYEENASQVPAQELNMDVQLEALFQHAQGVVVPDPDFEELFDVATIEGDGSCHIIEKVIPEFIDVDADDEEPLAKTLQVVTEDPQAILDPAATEDTGANPLPVPELSNGFVSDVVEPAKLHSYEFEASTDLPPAPESPRFDSAASSPAEYNEVGLEQPQNEGLPAELQTESSSTKRPLFHQDDQEGTGFYDDGQREPDSDGFYDVSGPQTQYLVTELDEVDETEDGFDAQTVSRNVSVDPHSHFVVEEATSDIGQQRDLSVDIISVEGDDEGAQLQPIDENPEQNVENDVDGHAMASPSWSPSLPSHVPMPVLANPTAVDPYEAEEVVPLAAASLLRMRQTSSLFTPAASVPGTPPMVEQSSGEDVEAISRDEEANGMLESTARGEESHQRPNGEDVTSSEAVRRDLEIDSEQEKVDAPLETLVPDPAAANEEPEIAISDDQEGSDTDAEGDDDLDFLSGGSVDAADDLVANDLPVQQAEGVPLTADFTEDSEQIGEAVAQENGHVGTAETEDVSMESEYDSAGVKEASPSIESDASLKRKRDDAEEDMGSTRSNFGKVVRTRLSKGRKKTAEDDNDDASSVSSATSAARLLEVTESPLSSPMEDRPAFIHSSPPLPKGNVIRVQRSVSASSDFRSSPIPEQPPPPAPPPLPSAPPVLMHAHSHRRPAVARQATAVPKPAAQRTPSRPTIKTNDTRVPSPAPSANSEQAPTPTQTETPALNRKVTVSTFTPAIGTPVTRAHCRYHKISMLENGDDEDEDGTGPRIFFLVPGCSITDHKFMKDEFIVDEGDATVDDGARMIGNIESLPQLRPYVIATIRHLVGLDIFREQEVFYLPKEGEIVANAPTPLEFHHQPTPQSLTRERSKARVSSANMYGSDGPLSPAGSRSSSRAPLSAAGSTSTSSITLTRRRRGKQRGSPAPSQILSHESLSEEESPSERRIRAAELEGIKAAASNSPLRTRRSRRLDAEAAEYQPAEGEETTDDEQTGRKKSQKKRGTKRARQSEAATSVPPEGEAEVRKTKRLKTRESVGPIASTSQK